MTSANKVRNVSSELASVDPTAYDNRFLLKKQTEKIGQTFREEPSSVLQDVKAFLPRLAAANRSLEGLVQAGHASSVDIECLDNTDGPVINMDIALMEQSGTDSSDSGTESDGEDDLDLLQGEITEDNIKLRSRVPGRKPHIEVVDPTGDGVNTVTTTEQDSPDKVTTTEQDSRSEDT